MIASSLAVLIGLAVAGVNGYISTWGGDATRQKIYANANLDPAVVNSTDFGRLQSVSLPLSKWGGEQIYAQPLAFVGADGVEYVFVATMQNNIYTVNPTTGKVLMNRTVATPYNITDDPYYISKNCFDCSPLIGITGTPVIDESTQTAYFFSKSGNALVGVQTAGIQYKFYAVDVMTGNDRPNFPILIQGTASNDATKSFNASIQLQRPAMLMSGDIVYGTFGSHCDVPNFYNGWLVSVDVVRATITQLWVVASGQLDSSFNGGASIWMAGAGPAMDDKGSIYVTTANGAQGKTALPATLASSTIPPVLSECLLRFTPGGASAANASQLGVADYFMSSGWSSEDATDADYGSAGAVLCPPGFKTSSGNPTVATVTKGGSVEIYDRTNLGGLGQGPNGSDNVVAKFGLKSYVLKTFQENPESILVTPTMWDGGAVPYVYVPLWKVGLVVLSFVNNALTPVAMGPYVHTIAHIGSACVTTLNNRANSSLVWVSDRTGTLTAYFPEPNANKGLDIAFQGNFPGNVTKFSIPGFSSANTGRVFVATFDGRLHVFGNKNGPGMVSEAGLGNASFPTASATISSNRSGGVGFRYTAAWAWSCALALIAAALFCF